MAVPTLHPHTKADVRAMLREASGRGTRVLVTGGHRHLDKGNPVPVDVELWTTQLDRIVAYEPADMVAVVEAGIRVGHLAAVLGERGQEWPVDQPADATVGGVIAAGASSPRRLRVGAVRDSVLEVEVVTGDGRLVKGGGRTVKNVTGYDLPRLLTGSLGTLGAIVQVALKVRPLPRARRTLVARGDALDLGRRLLEAVPLAAAVLASPGTVEVRLEGWPDEIEAQTAAARRVTADLLVLEDADFPTVRPWQDAPVVVEAALPPSRAPALAAAAGEAWGALLGAGIVWVGLPSADGALSGLRARVAELGGIAPVVRGPGGLGGPPPPAMDVQRRLKAAFDPRGILAPGRGWGGL
jgi:glycolate oxidase FAD binding subunit